MSLCNICNKNQAVIFTTRLDGASRVSEGICLKCAYEGGLHGMDDLFLKAGINKNNIDELTERMNQVIGQMGGQKPEDLFRALLDSDGLDFDLGQAMGLQPAEDEADDAPSQSELMPASIGSDSEEPGRTAERQAGGARTRSERERDRRRKFLDQFGTNLTRRAAAGKIDRIIGREKELGRVIQILNRRSKNNPALIGEPGVGKTAIAEGLAVRIHEGRVPAKLLDQEVYLLDMTAMVAGTQFRGQFESRMKGVVDDARNAGNIILVIDELHNIMGAGDAEGAMNAANILKPALAKGEIRVIGSTTLDEYRRFIEKDSALERRFQQVIVDEPSAADSIEILKGIRDYYEKHHHVTYSDEVIEAAVRLSERYITERFLPDKAIDLLDEAGSQANLNDHRLVDIQNQQTQLAGIQMEREALEMQITGNQNEAEATKLYERKADLQTRELRLRETLEQLEAECQPVAISENDIAQVVEMWTGIPVQRITETESQKLLNLEQRLHERVIGQDEAVSAVSRAIRRNRAGLGKKHKPSSFIFVGPTGVGKTELVKALAYVLFESEEALVRLDMSEFMEAHTVSKLIGSPPGYVGYDDGGQLTEKIRRKPYSVILLDEIEKAHTDVNNILLQILDDGRLTDSHGRVVNFENTVIVMTSNAGTTLKGTTIGFGGSGRRSMENRVDTVMKELFRPEFLNRIDEIIIFTELSREEIRQIVNLMIEEVAEGLKNLNLKLVVTDAARDALAYEGYDVRYGARPLRKTIQKRIEDKLADLLLSGKLESAVGVSVDYRQEPDESGSYQFEWL